MEKELLLTTEQVALRLGVHRKTVQRYIQSGRLKGTKLGRDYRILESSVEALLPREEVTPAPVAVLTRPPGPAIVTAVVNQKGGVGKTTTTLNLGVALSRRGRRVLLVDLDPQAALTVSIGVAVGNLELSIYQALCNEQIDPTTIVRKTTSGVDILPATIDLAAAEVELANVPGRDLVLRDLLDKLRPNYDHILIDTPPSLSLLTMNALGAANQVIIPLQCEFLATRGLKLLLQTLEKVQLRLNRSLVIAGILPTMFDARLNHAKEILQELREAFPGQVFDIVIRDNARAKESPMVGLSLLDYDARGALARAYTELAEVIDDAR